MNINSKTLTYLGLGLLWSIFMGITFISIGLGSVFPDLVKISGPFVCPHGQMAYNTETYQVSPVEGGKLFTWYCVDNQTGKPAELDFWPKHLYSGLIYGVLLFVVLIALFFLSLRIRWLPAAIVVAFVVAITIFSVVPIIQMTVPSPTQPVDATATALEDTYESLLSGAVSNFKSTVPPLPSWKGIPVMSQAVSGEEKGNKYVFDVPTDTGTINSFYTGRMKSLGWTVEDSQMLGMRFTKGGSSLLVGLAPAADEQSFVVTLILNP